MKPMNVVRKYGNKIAAAGTGLVLSGMSVLAHAADPVDIDVTPVVAQVAKGATAGVALGGASLALVALISVFVWLRRPVK